MADNNQTTGSNTVTTTETPTAVQQAINDFAARVGADPDKISYLDPNFSQLLMKGAVIRLKTGAYTGVTQITPADLGIFEEDLDPRERKAVKNLFRDLGKRPLIQPSVIHEFDSVRSKARGDIDRLCYRLFDGTTRFCPENAYEDLMPRLEAHQKRYGELTDDLALNLDKYRESLRPDYEVWARKLWTQLYAGKTGDRPDVEAYVSVTTDQLMILNKSPEKILSQFKFVISIAVLPLAEDLARDQSAAQQIRVNTQVEREMVATQSRMQRDLLAQQAATRDETLNEFWAGVRGGLRQELYDAMVDSLAALEGKTNLPPSNVSALKRRIEWVEKMQFWPDTDLDAQMQKVKMLVIQAESSSSPNTEVMDRVMRNIGARLRLDMLDMDYRPQRESRAGRATGLDVGIPESREGLEFVLTRNQRQSRPMAEILATDVSLDEDLDIETTARRSTATQEEVAV